MTLSALNAAGLADFVATCGPLFEHSEWIAERAWQRRPFSSLKALHRELMRTVEGASAQEKIALIRAHPDLVGRMAGKQALSATSAAEQAAAGLSEISPEEAAQFRAYNRQYHDRFGFPFVICARENRKETILRSFPQRLAQSGEQEVATAVAEVGKIAWLRLQDAVTEE